MDRRNFLSEFFGFGKDAVKTSLGLKETEELLSDIGKWERESYWSTTGENAIVIIGKIVVMLYVKKATDVKVGNASSEKIEEKLKEDPITAGLMANVIAPVTEEVIFRLLPDRVWSTLMKAT